MKAARNLILFLCWALQAPALLAHGSITAEGDLCIIRIGFYTAHFKVFQPQTSRDREYCEDLPDTGESIFVMDYVHKGLAEVPIEFRIIRDATGLGRFARLADVLALGDLQPLTVFYQPPLLEPGVFTVLHEFTDQDAYIGIVSVRHPETGELYQAVFPFTVGFQGWGLTPLFAALVVIAQLGYWISTGGYARWRARRRAPGTGFVKAMSLVPLLLLMGAEAAPESQGVTDAVTAAQPSWVSDSGKLRASYSSEVEPVPLNRIHTWTLHLETAEGTALENAQVEFTGGMPAHNHGLATAPAVISLGGGDYRVEGLRFHMQGAWELRITVRYANMSDRIVIPLNL
jgi:hypothetical protein